MRSATPWLGSLILHSIFLAGLMAISRPPELPKQLPLDFNLVLQAVEKVPSVADSPPPVATPQPVKKEPKRVVEKKPLPVKPVPLPEIVESVEPLPLEPVPVPEIVESVEPQPPVVIEQPVSIEPPALTQNPVEVSAAETRSAEAVLYAQTVDHVRGQVLDKLTYPTIARRMGWCGKLVLGFVLCVDGTVEDLQVLESSGHKVLDRAAMKAVVANAPFGGGYPRTVVKLPINFILD